MLRIILSYVLFFFKFIQIIFLISKSLLNCNIKSDSHSEKLYDR